MKAGSAGRPRRSSLVLGEMRSLLSLDPYLATVREISIRVRTLRDSDRNRLLSHCERAFREVDLCRIEPLRVASAKIIVSLLPYTAETVRHWIGTASGRCSYEVHFSLFCFLNDVADVPDAGAFAAQVPSLVGQYLLNVATESARAAWMAGDLLGDHWDVSEALPVLLRAAMEARFAAGRGGALHGLEHALESLLPSDPRRESVVALLREVSEVDRSEKIREYAKRMLEEDKGTTALAGA